ncbi:hypothetical protein A6R68_18969 [Neotoma lepida]|uniref:Uncharacterized protein n=1 Tax=Neotoma lepida TaxID=56216 RepID=A0A1A6HK78_NEOLE|nr:hypothetical protein A6R68_18969 [Neotoma lepida]
MKMQGAPYGILKRTWFYREPKRKTKRRRRGPQAGALAATRPSSAPRHSRRHKETAHSPNTLPVGAGDPGTVASARSPREHLRTCRLHRLQPPRATWKRRGKAAAARAAAPAHSPGSAANGDREARSGQRRRPAVAAAANSALLAAPRSGRDVRPRPLR